MKRCRRNRQAKVLCIAPQSTLERVKILMHPKIEQQRHLTRREFFGRSACGLGTAALALLLKRDGFAATPNSAIQRPRIGGLPQLPHYAPKAKRVIYLFQNGAPTHVDLFDHKPKLKE